MPVWRLLGEAGIASARIRTKHCTKPVRLQGSTRLVSTHHRRGAPCLLLERRDRRITSVPCGNRRAAVCDACSATYKRDAWGLITAGLTGGKGIPASVADHPCTFATLTAPSFGAVHGTRQKGLCRARRDHPVCPHGRPLWCTRQHRHDDPRLGEPLCADCYDYTAHVVWQWYAPELWRRFTIALQRDLACRAGLSVDVFSRGLQDLLLQGRRVPGPRRDPRARADPPGRARRSRRPRTAAGAVAQPISRTRSRQPPAGCRPCPLLWTTAGSSGCGGTPRSTPAPSLTRPTATGHGPGGRASGAGRLLPGEVPDQGHRGLWPPGARHQRRSRPHIGASLHAVRIIATAERAGRGQ